VGSKAIAIMFPPLSARDIMNIELSEKSLSKEVGSNG